MATPSISTAATPKRSGLNSRLRRLLGFFKTADKPAILDPMKNVVMQGWLRGELGTAVWRTLAPRAIGEAISGLVAKPRAQTNSTTDSNRHALAIEDIPSFFPPS